MYSVYSEFCGDLVTVFRAVYMDGKPTGAVTPCAGNQGTLITVCTCTSENIFGVCLS